MDSLKTLLIILLVALSGCGSIKSQVTEPVGLHQLYIDANGDLLDPEGEQKIENEEKYVQSIIDNFYKEKQSRPNLKLTIFIHGGLNTFESATGRVKELRGSMLEDGRYPVFISWRSGGPSNYLDHLFFLRRGEKVNFVVGGLTSPFVLAEDLLRSLARTPASTWNVLVGQNSVARWITDDEEQAYFSSVDELINLGFNVERVGNINGHGFEHFWSIWNPAKVFTAPFVDGLGTGSWNSMLRRTDLVLRRNDGFDGLTEYESETAATKFFRKLSEEHRDEELLLIGHSMGTIIANNIVSRFQELHFSEIVYMAAACTVKDIELVIAPYLYNNQKSRFYNLSLNPYRDILESNFFDFAPRGSLLIWIDDTLGTVNSFQNKTAGFWFNIVRGASEAFKDPSVRSRVVLTRFGIADSTPQNHGDFDEAGNEFWNEQFWNGR